MDTAGLHTNICTFSHYLLLINVTWESWTLINTWSIFFFLKRSIHTCSIQSYHFPLFICILFNFQILLPYNKRLSYPQYSLKMRKIGSICSLYGVYIKRELVDLLRGNEYIILPFYSFNEMVSVWFYISIIILESLCSVSIQLVKLCKTHNIKFKIQILNFV